VPGSPPWPSQPTEGAQGPSPAADIAEVAAVAGAALRDAGVPVGPEQCQRFARAVTLLHDAPRLSPRELRACGLATLVTDPEQIEVLDGVFAALFGGLSSGPQAAGQTGPPGGPPDPDRMETRSQPGPWQPPSTAGTPQPPGAAADPRSGQPRPVPHRPDPGRNPEPSGDLRVLASAAERLGSRDFAELSAGELGQMEALMREFALATPFRRTRRRRRSPAGDRADLRTTLRQARRTHGEPVKLARTAARERPRRLIVLCDISGSMEPYARALLQLMYCVTSAGRTAGRTAGGTAGRAVGGTAGRAAGRTAARPEVFTFATRLTRITADLSALSFGTVLERAGKTAPDWSGGTRIGAALKEFNDSYGRHGMARGAVVLIISDGWETGDATQLGDEMARLSRVAHRIVWANPRTKSPRYRPEVSGMAAAWPYCDAVVSAHSLDALDGLIAALGAR
jgi:uncharacterized protein